jgi:Au+-exporting ATPase
MVGAGYGAEPGILFHKGEALQPLQGAGVVALDKTGTLTEGKPVLTNLTLAPGFVRADVLAAVAAVEGKSEHPIARAVMQAAKAERITLPLVTRYMPGRRSIRMTVPEAKRLSKRISPRQSPPARILVPSCH